MEHPINRSTDENDPCLSVTALVVVLALIFTLYFSLRFAVPDLPLRVHHALADLPSESGKAANALSMLW
jgi:hypothetical protein